MIISSRDKNIRHDIDNKYSGKNNEAQLCGNFLSQHWRQINNSNYFNLGIFFRCSI